MGWIGLRTALRLYNPNLGFSFSTYACTRISGTIRDYIRAENLIPKRLTTFNRKVIAVEEALTLSLGRSPRVDEIAASLGVTTSDLSILPRLQNPASLDELITDDEGNERSQIYISSGNDPVDNLLISERNKVIMDSLTKLDPIDAKIITLIIFEGKKPSEIELIIGENSRKIRLRKERAFNQIKNDLLSWN
jgi:RNA polymerase sigma factor (sigma-70 family)